MANIKSSNPMIAETPSETIDRCTNALKWLMSADTVIEGAFGGSPSDDIQFGRYLLGECCLSALKSAARDVELHSTSAARGDGG